MRSEGMQSPENQDFPQSQETSNVSITRNSHETSDSGRGIPHKTRGASVGGRAGGEALAQGGGLARRHGAGGARLAAARDVPVHLLRGAPPLFFITAPWVSEGGSHPAYLRNLTTILSHVDFVSGDSVVGNEESGKLKSKQI